MTTLMAAVAAATTAPRLYAVGGVPQKPTYPYGSYSATIGRGDSHTLDDEAGLNWVRVVVQSFGKTADSALAHASQIVTDLAGRRLAFDDHETSRLRVELDPAVIRDPDDNGVVGVTTTLTATATKETD